MVSRALLTHTNNFPVVRWPRGRLDSRALKSCSAVPTLGLPGISCRHVRLFSSRPLSRYGWQRCPLNWWCFVVLLLLLLCSPLAWFVVVVQCRHSFSSIGIRNPWSWSSLRMTTVVFARVLFMLYISRAFFFVGKIRKRVVFSSLGTNQSKNKNAHLFRVSKKKKKKKRSGSKSVLSSFHFLDPTRERDPEKKKQITKQHFFFRCFSDRFS